MRSNVNEQMYFVVFFFMRHLRVVVGPLFHLYTGLIQVICICVSVYKIRTTNVYIYIVYLYIGYMPVRYMHVLVLASVSYDRDRVCEKERETATVCIEC